MHLNKNIIIILLILFGLNSCILKKIPGGDAKKNPPDPKLRVQKNLEEGRGFKFSTKNKQAGVFEFASSNELWRASLDTIDFMPLASVNYSGGIIITDWYSTEQDSNESIKISIRFLTNEIASNSLDIKVFNKKCKKLSNCVISEKTGNLVSELKKKILKTAAVYKEEEKKKKKK